MGVAVVIVVAGVVNVIGVVDVVNVISIVDVVVVVFIVGAATTKLTRVVVDHDVCVKRNSPVISEF